MTDLQVLMSKFPITYFATTYLAMFVVGLVIGTFIAHFFLWLPTRMALLSFALVAVASNFLVPYTIDAASVLALVVGIKLRTNACLLRRAPRSERPIEVRGE